MKMLPTLTLLFLFSCTGGSKQEKSAIPAIAGNWKLLSGTLIEKGDSTVTDYTKNLSFIKLITATHFSFLLHDLSHGNDSSKTFSAGGGRYTLSDSTYTEHLEYCSDRNWEGHDFSFTVSFHGDTLVQRGREKIDSAGIDRINIEKYLRIR